jgi:hypothetical protein
MPTLFPGMSTKMTKGSIALTFEIDCDQMAMVLPPVTFAIFLTAKCYSECLGGIFEMPLLMK